MKFMQMEVHWDGFPALRIVERTPLRCMPQRSDSAAYEFYSSKEAVSTRKNEKQMKRGQEGGKEQWGQRGKEKVEEEQGEGRRGAGMRRGGEMHLKLKAVGPRVQGRCPRCLWTECH